MSDFDDDSYSNDQDRMNQNGGGGGGVSADGSKTTTLNHHDDDHSSNGGDSSFGVRETKKLVNFRLYFVLFLFFIALALAIGIYFLTRSQEKQELSMSFDVTSTKLIDRVHSSIERKIGSLESLSFEITSYSNWKNLTWPYVTIPDFAYKAAGVRALSHAVSIELCPLVEHDQRTEWELYTQANADKWIQDGLDFEELEKQGFFYYDHRDLQEQERDLQDDNSINIDTISEINDDGQRVPVPLNTDYYFPVWQSSPVASNLINLDLHSDDIFADNLDLVLQTSHAVVGKTVDSHSADTNPVLHEFDKALETRNDIEFYNTDGPVDFLYVPVFNVLDESTKRHPVAVLTTVLYWESYMYSALPPRTPEVRVVVTNECGEAFTYSVFGEYVEYVGIGDLHDTKYDKFEVDGATFNFESLETSLQRYHGVPLDDPCNYHMHIYPTAEYEEKYITYDPWIFFAMTIAIFGLLIFLIFCYDRRVEKNYQLVYKRAKQAGAIVSSIFPAAVRQRLYQDEAESRNSKGINNNEGGGEADGPAVPVAVNATKNKIKGFLNNGQPTAADGSGNAETEPTTTAEGGGGPASATPYKMDPEAITAKAKTSIGIGKAIADLFPDVTIMFSDVVGFTAWSSQRDPGEVFTFLQNLYHEFDTAARSMKVFKVETIGDSYVAATGLPEPQPDHAVRMARFAAKCMIAMSEVTRDLEIKLGPDTGELRLRMGLHSGPVTAGVLKGAKARFQLFGDTMNMAARMEHNSLPGRIQCSETTADLLNKAGKGHWVNKREEKVWCKGKGEVVTYWLTPKTGAGSVASNNDERNGILNLTEHHTAAFGGGGNDFDANNVDTDLLANAQLVFDLGSPNNRYHRLIDWNVELLSDLLKQVEAKRIDDAANKKQSNSMFGSKGRNNNKNTVPTMELQGGSTALDEVSEIVALPQVNDDPKTTRKTRARDIVLTPEVMSQLRDYVTTIASMYRPNAFHNFEHASHVTMSTHKLLKRVTVKDGDFEDDAQHSQLHQYTYGITSDALTQFTLVFCALIHDVDHAGVSNFQLIKEKATIAQLYKNKSVAEQNSVDLSWDLLMDPRYRDLQKAIYSDDDELKRFRQLMVNIVLATDIFDKDMKDMRDRRWGRAFQYANVEEEEEKEEDMPKRALDRDYDTPLSNIEGANLKATIVMEHLIQASDVAHTMQHWEIYLKWNERLFNEMYSAFDHGRAGKDPSVSWYEGEIMFFDKYVIPLAKKLAECRVFGVSSDECLNYANQNRKLWAIRGDEIIEEFLQRYKDRMEAAAATGNAAPAGPAPRAA